MEHPLGDLRVYANACFMPPGHVPVVEAGTVLSMISPADQLAATDAAVEAAMQAQ